MNTKIKSSKEIVILTINPLVYLKIKITFTHLFMKLIFIIGK